MSRGHVRKQGRSSWELKFDVARDPLTGRRVTKFKTFRGTRRKAEEELTRLLSQRDQGTFLEPTKQTVAQFLLHWLEADVDRRLAARTAARHREIVQRNINPRLGHFPVRSLTPAHIEAFEADLQREGWVRRRAVRKANADGQLPKLGLSAQTVLHVHRTLSQALNHAVRIGVLYRNPAQQVRPPRPPRREIKILTKEEIGGLLQAAHGSELQLPILLSLTTGVRRGELLGLRWSDIDLDSGRLTVNQALERVKGSTAFKPPKTATSRRTITLPVACVNALKEHRARQAEQRLALGLGRDPRALVLAQPDGGPLGPDGLSKAFKRLVERIRVTPITFHGLRHTHISHLLMEGVHVKVVSERAGHANVSITLSVYAACIPNMQADAALRVDAWLR